MRSSRRCPGPRRLRWAPSSLHPTPSRRRPSFARSEEHTSELQSQSNLVCRLLLEKKKQQKFVCFVPRYNICRNPTSSTSYASPSRQGRSLHYISAHVTPP